MNNKVSLEQIEAKLDKAVQELHVFHGKELCVSYKLECGFTVTGRSAVVDPANFDIGIGIKYAYLDAVEQMWPLEGYLLQNRLYNEMAVKEGDK